MEFNGLQRNRSYKKFLKIAIISFTVIALLIPFLIWENNNIVISEYTKISNQIPDSFNRFTIVQISDLHSKAFKGRLVSKIANLNPDLIVITGDLIDSSDKNIEVAEQFVKQAVNLADVYFVTGNHEYLSSQYSQLLNMLDEYGVTVLDNSYEKIIEGNDSINIYGISDTEYAPDTNLELSSDDFNIVLCHKPYNPELFSKMEADLVFSGHAHGGQIRIPFVGGIIAPDQGFFPKYSEGLHNYENTSLVISRGLGNSIFPLRLFNRPELVVVRLFNSYQE
jgi:hypothetical protein